MVYLIIFKYIEQNIYISIIFLSGKKYCCHNEILFHKKNFVYQTKMKYCYILQNSFSTNGYLNADGFLSNVMIIVSITIFTSCQGSFLHKNFFPFCLFNCVFPMDISIFYCRMSRHEQFNLREKRVLIRDMLFVIPKRNNSIAFLSTSICFIRANFRSKTNISCTT